MKSTTDILSIQEFDRLKARLRALVGQETADIIIDLIFAFRQEHERNDHRPWRA